MKAFKFPKYLKNKFIIAGMIFFVYALFLDENDVFTIISQKSKLNKLEEKKAEYQAKLNDTTSTLEKLNYQPEVERFARERKYFKKDDEDVFVIFYE